MVSAGKTAPVPFYFLSILRSRGLPVRFPEWSALRKTAPVPFSFCPLFLGPSPTDTPDVKTTLFVSTAVCAVVVVLAVPLPAGAQTYEMVGTRAQGMAGAFVACPDPIDFRAYTVVNLYEDANAYWIEGPFRRTPRPGRRNYLGHVSATLEQLNHLELALASHGRSGGQWDIWQAVYSPVGDDGYPRPIWDKRTGEIDRKVADYWKEHYDLSWILRRDWAILGPKLRGKLHIYVGDMDNYYLNLAVYHLEDFLKSAAGPKAEAVFEYGRPMKPHGWQPFTNAELLHLMAARINKTAPGAVATK